VTGRALTLAIRLLCTSAAAAAVVSLEGCYCVGYEPWAPADVLELATDADLHAVVQLQADSSDHVYAGLAVGAGGSVIAWGHDYSPTTYDSKLFVEASQIGDADLHAVWVDDSAWWVVGDAGMAAVSDDRGLTWTPVDLGTTADLRGIAAVGSRLVVVGDGVVRLQGGDGIWVEVPAPAGGWGDLRAVHHDGSRVYVVGLAGKIWSALDPSDEWIAEDIGTNADLFDVGTFGSYYDEPMLAVVGSAGTLLFRDADGWKSVESRTSVDLIAYENGRVLAAGGGLYEIDDELRLRHVDTLNDAQALSSSGDGAIAVGTNGAAYEKPYYACEGGRPFIVRGEPVTAELRGPTRPGLAGAVSSEREAALARAWAEDGLVEHASIASFARFAIELLALGAPPDLLREVHVAVTDELRHAKLCFDLARRFGGVAVEPGALPLPMGVLRRVGDPVATALALFEEGCINESLAACEAADAAGACEDVEIREVLETIAADERRHATMAWGALRWLIDTHGERVRAPLRARLAQVGRVWLGSTRECDDFELDAQLIAHGRLSPHRRARVHRRVHAELIFPLACGLLEPTMNVTLAVVS
jgi:hypothetical protein